MRIRAAGCLLLALCLAKLACAQERSTDQSTYQLASSIVHAMNADASFDDALDQYRKSFIARLSQRYPAELARELVDKQIMPELHSHKDELLDLKVKALVDQFTMAELRQIDAFYTSPVGQRLVSIQSNARAYTDALRRILRNASDRVNAMELASAFVPMNNQAARK